MLIGWECKPPAGGEMPAKRKLSVLVMKPEGTDGEAYWKRKRTPRRGRTRRTPRVRRRKPCFLCSTRLTKKKMEPNNRGEKKFSFKAGQKNQARGA
jgi:hypothetical protein